MSKSIVHGDTPGMSLEDTEKALVLSHFEHFHRLLDDLDHLDGDSVEAQRVRERMRRELEAIEKIIETLSDAPDVI